MKKRLFKDFCLIFLIIILPSINCAQDAGNKSYSLINTSHLDFLYEDIKLNGKSMAIIHIYSNYPEYKWVGDDDEGIACVDDAARAAFFYLKLYESRNNEESLNKAKKLLDFILHMQADNGFFYNFIWDDLSINTTFKTSVAQADWWTWRALWVLMEGYNILKDEYPTLAGRLFSSVKKNIAAVKTNIPVKYETKIIDGFKRPAWLPYETASDQTAILLLGLLPYYKAANDQEILDYINKLIEGILLMQEGDEKTFPYGAFLSWENLWHGWGNLQSYALLKASTILNDDRIKIAALKEINNFYQYLYEIGFMNEFKIKREGDNIEGYDMKMFSQIAYIIRPIIFAYISAYEVMGDSVYAVKAGRLSTWFFGNNNARQQMYFSESGKCFDGINDEDEINKNSGAESTIEALLSILAVENNSYAKNELLNYLNKKIETK